MTELDIMMLLKKGDKIVRFDMKSNGDGYGIWFESGVYLRLTTSGENQWGVEIHPRG